MNEIKFENGTNPFPKGVVISSDSEIHVNPLGEGVKLDCEVIHTQVQFLEGKVLTVIDASITGVQNKAVKDIIKKAFSDQLTYIRTLCYPEIRMMTYDEAESTIGDLPHAIATGEILK